MAKTKLQKNKDIEVKGKRAEESETLIVADITKISVNDLTEFRRRLRAIGASFSLVKKRLLKIILESRGMTFKREEFPGQTGVVFSNKDLHETATAVWGFAKTKNNKEEIFKILGGYAITEKKFIDGKEVKMIGSLPTRDVLLGQLVGMIASPIRKFLFVLNEKSKMVEKQ